MAVRTNPPLSSLGERGFLKKFLPRLAAFQGGRFLVPPGDDSAVLKGPGTPVLSIDGLTEGTHFKSSWDKRCRKIAGFPLARGLGWKLLGSALSDLAAMGATSNRWAMTYLGAPGHVRQDFLEELYRGLRDTATRYHCALAGGDTVRAKDISLVSAVGGTLNGSRPLTRDKAKAGDALCIAGTVGDAAVGLGILLGKIRIASKKDAAFFVRRFFQHEPLFAAGSVLAREPDVTSLIDLSDSLGETLEIVAQRSRVGFLTLVDQVPVSSSYRRQFKKDGRLLAGGEDYALMFTVRPQSLKKLRQKLEFSVIGLVVPARQGIRFRLNGQLLAPPKFFGHYQ